jgi:hypothetical protein
MASREDIAAAARHRIICGFDFTSGPLDSPCWIWRKGMSGRGAQERPGFVFFGRKVKVHRTAFQLWRGEIPSGLELDHLCRTTLCVNPWHLEAVTHQENMARGYHARKVFCNYGHLLDGRRANGFRYCKTCEVRWRETYRESNAEELKRRRHERYLREKPFRFLLRPTREVRR